MLKSNISTYHKDYSLSDDEIGDFDREMLLVNTCVFCSISRFSAGFHEALLISEHCLLILYNCDYMQIVFSVNTIDTLP